METRGAWVEANLLPGVLVVGRCPRDYKRVNPQERTRIAGTDQLTDNVWSKAEDVELFQILVLGHFRIERLDAGDVLDM